MFDIQRVNTKHDMNLIMASAPVAGGIHDGSHDAEVRLVLVEDVNGAACLLTKYYIILPVV